MHLARVLLLLLAAAPLTAVAGPKEESEAHIARAMEAHGQNNFSVALQELETAYSLDPNPDLLYAIAQVHVKLDQCDQAIAWYEKFLATNPAAQAIADTKEAIEMCKARLPPPAPEPAPPPPSPEPVSPAVISTESAPWYKDRLGGALVGVGVAAGLVGVVVYGGARGDLDAAEDAPTLSGYNELVDSAHSKRMTSVVLVGGGLALIGAGVVRYWLHSGATQETRGVGVVPTSGGGLVTWSGAF